MKIPYTLVYKCWQRRSTHCGTLGTETV